MAEVEADATRAEPGADSMGHRGDPFVGKVLNGRFHIVRPIARGGMGSVYFATQTPLSRPVAVKVLHVFRDGDAEPEESFRRRFLQEASILAKLQHPNIVMLFDYGQIVGTTGEDYFMAMEYLRGETLAQRFKARGRLGVAASIDLARQIGRGLREAHRCGFIHRDLKPSNIMLVPEDEKNDIVKLVDFGIGKILPGGAEAVRYTADETRAGILLGSPRYMAPEQIRSEPVEARTDLYGLGVILFQALTGRVPFDGPSFDVLLAHCLAPPPALSEACPDDEYPERLSRLVRGLLEKEVTARPTIDEFLKELAAVEDEIPGGSGGPSPSQRSPVMTVPSILSGPPTAGTTSARRPPARNIGSTAFAARKRGVGVGIALSTVLALSVLVGRSLRSGSAVPARLPAVAMTPPRSSASLPGPIPPAAIASASPVSVDEDADHFALTIESTPTGANVVEDGEVVATTPTTITVARPSAGVAPRRFSLQMDGYAPYPVEPGDSSSPLRVHAVLEAASASKTSAPGGRAGSPSRSRAQHNPSSQSSDGARSDGSGLEIRLRR